MSTASGRNGVVSAGGNVVGEMIRWTLDTTSGIEDTSVAGSDEARPRGTKHASNGEVECYLDIGDTGQSALIAGDLVDLTMQPEGVGPGLPQYVVTQAVVEAARHVVDGQGGAYNRITFSWQGGKADPTPQV